MAGAETTARAGVRSGANAAGLSTLPLLLRALGVSGGKLGTWHVPLPDPKTALALSPGPLGMVLSVRRAAAVPALLIGGRTVGRCGVRAVIVAAGPTLVKVGVSLGNNTWALIGLLMAFFAAIGL